MAVGINSLPPEIIQLIVETIDEINGWENLTGREFGINLPGGNSRRRRRERERRNGGRGPHGNGGDEDDEDDDDAPMNPGEALMAMLGGLIGGGGGGARGQNATRTGQAPQPAQPQPAAATTGPTNPTPTQANQPAAPFRFGSSTNTTNGGSFNFNSTTTAADNSSDDEMPPLESVIPQASTSAPSRPANGTTAQTPTSTSTAKGKKPAESDSDDDMPPLESVLKPSTSKGKAPASTTNNIMKPISTNDSDSDEMPPLEHVGKPSNPSPSKPIPSSSSTSKPSTSSSGFPSSFASNLKGLKGVFSSSSKKPLASKAPAKVQEKPQPKPKPQDSDSDEMPPLEPVSCPKPPTNRGTDPRSVLPDSDDDMPPLESVLKPPTPSTSNSTSTSTSTAKGKGKAPVPATQAKKPAVTIKDEDSDSDEMPALEPFRPSTSSAPTSSSRPTVPTTATPSRPVTSAPSPPVSRPTRAQVEESDDEMPPLEQVRGGGNAQPTTATTQNGNGGGGGGGGGSDSSDDSGDSDWQDADSDNHDSDEDDDEDEDEDDDDEDEDDSDSDVSSIATEDCLYEDGLPKDPMLPLMFVSRPFLHAARKNLYKKIPISSAFQARLLLDSLNEVEHAARAADEELVEEEDPFDEGEKEQKARGKNALAMMIRELSIDPHGVVSLGRGGGRAYIELLEKCRKLEKLVIKPMFMKSATKPLLKALNNLPKLTTLDVASSTAAKHPFLMTTPRLFAIQRSSPHLENLTVQFMKGGEAGDSDEEDEMWERADGEEEQPEEPAGGRASEQKGKEKSEGVNKKETKRKGLKTFSLYDFDVSSAEISLILRDSTKTLQTLALHRPGSNFTRFGFASTMLTYGHSLTFLDLNLPSSWYTKPKLTEDFKLNPPLKPKGYVHGKPPSELIGKVTEYHFILDAVMPYLPNLKKLNWVGPQASHQLFALMPAGLTTVAFAHCPSVQPKALARLLNKVINRTTTTTRPDGTKDSKTIKTKFAKGLICLTVSADDMSWSEEDIRLLESATNARDCCLHLSSESGPGMGMFGGGGAGIPLGPIDLGPVGLMGGLLGAAGIGRH
ncbi:hypothetical protein JCM5350_000205 [Sporobolomyces pararoseus]